MNRTMFAVIVIAVVLIILLAMWFGWRSRTRRDSAILTSQSAPTSSLIEQFARVMYVSTTPVGEPLSRVAAPGLRYRGRADVSVFEDGVTVQVDGEDPVHFLSSQLAGSGAAGRRVGKAVEEGGLALMRWHAEGRALESSFRFESRAEQRRFTEAFEQISQHTAAASPNDSTSTSQEGVK